MESRHLLNLNIQKALDCTSENFNHKHFPRGACARNSLEKGAGCSPDGRYHAHIATVSLGPHLSQNPLSALGTELTSTTGTNMTDLHVHAIL